MSAAINTTPPISQVFHGGLRADGPLQYESRSRNGRVTWADVFFPQSPFDKACGIHALAVSLALAARVPRGSLENLASATRGPWRAFWESAHATYFEGTSCRDLEKCVSHLDGVAAQRLRITSPEQLYRVCRAAIESGGVPLLDLQGPQIAHWSVGVGVECRGAVPSAVLCLDPSAGAPWACFANARLSLTPAPGAGTKGKPLFRYRDNDGRAKLARARHVLIVSARPGAEATR